ncbi:MAG: PASTA domain-containing protein [Planctomycetes bacterium]|nr:PASTA domain-containing protein [Planctomycetota bacterium]
MRKFLTATMAIILVSGCTMVSYYPGYYAPPTQAPVQEPVTSSITVPNVVGMTLQEAQNALWTSSLVPGDTSYQIGGERKDVVLSQSVAAGTEMPAYAKVDLAVSAGAAQTYVPALVGLEPSAADGMLRQFGLRTGTVQYVELPGINEPKVVSQTPQVGASVTVNTAVNYTVAIRRSTVAVPNIVGQQLSAAKRTLASAGLSLGKITPSYGNGTPNTIKWQSPARGTQVPPGSAVDIMVLMAPRAVSVPNLYSMSAEQASRALSEAGLAMGRQTRVAGTTQNQVVSQNPAAGSRARAGSGVDIVLGGQRIAYPSPTPRPVPQPTPQPVPQPVPQPTPQPVPQPVPQPTPQQKVRVPFVMGKSEEEARGILVQAGLQCSVVAVQNRNLPRDVVISQNPAVNTLVDAGTPVQITVNKTSQPIPPPVPTVAVPSILGQTEAAAQAALRRAGLQGRRDGVREVADARGNSGRIAEQTPAPGTQVPRGTTVGYVITVQQVKKPDKQPKQGPGTVPTPGKEAPGKPSQPSQPSQPGHPNKPTKAPEAKTVNIPNVVGNDLNKARGKLSGLSVTINFVRGDKDRVVIAQSLAPGTKVAQGTQVVLTVSMKE